MRKKDAEGLKPTRAEIDSPDLVYRPEDVTARRYELSTTFFILCEEGSFAGAGRRLGITGTAVRSRIQSLEFQIHEPLVTESGPFKLTDYGARVWKRCRPAHEMLMGLWWPGQIDPNELNIAADWYARRYLLPQVLGTLVKLHPHVRIWIRDTSFEDNLRKVVSGWARFLVGGGQAHGREQDLVKRLHRKGIGRAVRAVWAYSGSIAAADAPPPTLAHVPRIYSQDSSGATLEVYHERYPGQAGGPAVQTAFDAAALAAEGLGIALIPRVVAAEFGDSLVVRDLDKGAPDLIFSFLQISWVGDEDSLSEQAERDFVKLFLAEAERHADRFA